MIGSQFLPHMQQAPRNLTFDLHGSLRLCVMAQLAVEFGRCGSCRDWRLVVRGCGLAGCHGAAGAIYAAAVLCTMMLFCVIAPECHVKMTCLPEFGKVK